MMLAALDWTRTRCGSSKRSFLELLGSTWRLCKSSRCATKLQDPLWWSSQQQLGPRPPRSMICSLSCTSTNSSLKKNLTGLFQFSINAFNTNLFIQVYHYYWCSKCRIDPSPFCFGFDVTIKIPHYKYCVVCCCWRLTISLVMSPISITIPNLHHYTWSFTHYCSIDSSVLQYWHLSIAVLIPQYCSIDASVCSGNTSVLQYWYLTGNILPSLQLVLQYCHPSVMNLISILLQ